MKRSIKSACSTASHDIMTFVAVARNMPFDVPPACFQCDRTIEVNAIEFAEPGKRRRQSD